MLTIQIRVFLRLALALAHLPVIPGGIIAYDCTAPGMNVTEIDVTRVTGCEDEEDDVVERQVMIQLLQLNEEFQTEVTSCFVSISRLVQYCGMHSHTSAVAGGFAEFMLELREQACNRLYDTGSVQITVSSSLSGLDRDTMNVRAVTLAGSLTADGVCTGSSYSDHYGSWTGVVVQATVRVQTTRYTAKVNTKTDVVHLRKNVRCTWSRGSCMDSEAGETYWKSTSTDGCAQTNFAVLYEGPAVEINRTSAAMTEYGYMTYLVEQGEKIFALERKQPYADCPFGIWRTEHPRLLLAFATEVGFFIKKQTTTSASYDLMLYINAKFVYMSKVYERNFKAIANALSHERCMTRKSILETQLAIAYAAPTEFALLFTGEPGYTATMVGEVVYLSKCPTVQVALRAVDRCYHELPVTAGNRSMFLTPKTRILSRHGTEVLCNPLLVAKYFLAGSWITSAREVHEVRGPPETRVYGSTAYTYRAPRSVALGGIYSADEVSNMVNQLMFGTERQAAFARVAGKILNQPVSGTGLSFSQLVPQEHFERVAETLVYRAWSRLMMFGSIVSSILGFWILFRCALYLIECISNMKILHDLFGISFKLICSFSTALTTLLVHGRVKTNLASYTRTKTSKSVDTEVASAPLKEEQQIELAVQPAGIYPVYSPGM